MEIEGCQEFDLEFEADDLIDNDLFPETLDAGIDVNDHLPEMLKSSEPERNQRKGRYNIRQSLAWDNAFFTNAGVLDAEELSNIISGSDKKKNHMLPGIQEDITGSTESISTLQSDSLTLETRDDDLFLDIRASIQRTRASKKAPQFTNSSSKIAPMELDGPAITSPKKEDFVSKNKNQIPGVKKSGLQTVRMSKSQLKPIGKPVALGRPIKQDSVQSQTGSVRKTGGTKPVLPKSLKTVSSSAPSVAAKPDSVGTGRVKSECGSSKQGSVSVKGTQLPKVSALGGSRMVLPKPAVSLKSSSLGSSSIKSSTSSDNSISTFSGNVKKPLMTARRNLGKSNNTSTNTSSILKNPSRAVPNNKLPGTTLLSHPKSTKIPKSVSPASSISEWSSVSSSTSSVINQRCNNSRTSIDTSSCRSVDGDPRDNLPDQKAQRQRNPVAISTSCTSKRPSTESGTLQDPTKPSGLRLPSSRIGFFDRSSSRTPNGRQHPQSALRPGFPKNGAATSTPTRSSDGKLKNAKVSTARKATSPLNIKLSPNAASSPVSSQEKSLVSSVSMDVNDSSSLSLGVKGCRIEETCQKSVEVKAENSVEQLVDEGKVAVVKDNLCGLSLSNNVKSGDTETAAGEGGGSSSSELIGVKSCRIEETCQESVEVKAENSFEQVMDEGTVAVVKDNLCGLSLSNNMKSGDTETTEGGDSSISELTGVKGSRIEETCQKLEEVKAENDVEQVADAGTDAVEKDNLCVLSLNTNMNFTDTKTAAGEGGDSSSSELITQTGDSIPIEKNPIPTSETIEKENGPANYQGEGLSAGKRGIYQKNFLNECELSSNSEAAAYRPPFALKNSCSDKFLHKPAEVVSQFAVAVAEDAGFALPFPEEKENS